MPTNSGVAEKRYKVSFGGDENILKLDGGGSYVTLGILKFMDLYT